MTDPIKQPENIKDKDIKASPAAADLPGIAPANTNDAPKVEARANDNAPVVTAPVTARPAAEAPVVVPAVAPAAPAAPAAEAPKAPEAAAPEAAPAAAPTAEAVAPKKPGHSRGAKVAMAAFNFAVGVGLGMGTRAAAVAGLTFLGAPALAVVLGASVAVGAISTAWCHVSQNHALKKAGQEAKPFWSKKNLGVFAFSTGFSALGGLFGLGLPQQWFHGLMQHFNPAAAPAVVPHVAPVVAAPVVAPIAAPAVVVPPVVHCATPTEAFAELVKGHHVSAGVTDAMHRAASHNAHVAAQGTKDMAYYAQNGFGGVPKDGHVATELFKQAADGGNVQAKVDLLYQQHWGLNHIAQNKAASLASMHDVAQHSHNVRAESFVDKWNSAGKPVTSAPFNSDTILKGVKLGCPAI